MNFKLLYSYDCEHDHLIDRNKPDENCIAIFVICILIYSNRYDVELIHAVLEKTIEFSGSATGISCEIDEILQSVSFQHFSKLQIDKISNELSKKHFHDIQLEYKFTFTYLPQFFDDICSLKNPNQTEIELLSYVILDSDMTFISQLQYQKVMPEAHPLFKFFILIAFKSQKLQEISGKCFNHTFQLLVTYDTKYNIYDYVDYYILYAKII